jgi:integrase
MRPGEILNLRWDHVHIKNVIEPYLEISETKNNKKRFIPLNDDMLELLKSLKDNGSAYVFLGTHGKRLTLVRKPFIKALKKAGIEDFRFHDLRHTFASPYVMNNGDLLALKEILGHSDLKMVQRYAHLASSHKRR